METPGENIRDYLNTDTVVFDNPSFDNSIIGMTFDGRAIYLYEKMIEELVSDDMTEEDAVDWIEYNTLRTLPYIEGKRPVIVYDEISEALND